ncbi:MAG: TerB family tellurite resistance protein [Alphaproteobacteria bacterium]|nr:TerB family tellurite resistance protein [Alphaproteobacteria bacterium]
MFQQLLRTLSVPATKPPTDLRLAVAVLLIEAAYRDDIFQPEERDVIFRLLQGRFALTAEETSALLHAAEQTCQESVQLHPWTSAVTEQMTEADRIHLVEMMWEVAYADGVLDPEEDALIRRMVHLIHITDRDRMLARKRVLERIGRI